LVNPIAQIITPIARPFVERASVIVRANET